nr:cystathionine gamma-synthase-like [Nerophis lumbriciformis]
MAAIAAIFDQLNPGAVVVLPDDCYQGVTSLALRGQRKGLWQVEQLAVDDTPAWLDAARRADLIWLESPSNPLLIIADLVTICAAPRKSGALLVVDNTFATPLNQQPLSLGADVSVQSATKYLGGHSDLLAGIATTADEALAGALRSSRTQNGATPGTLEAFLTVRGLRTLALRLERAQTTALLLAERLQAHDRVTSVRYPGLASHPQHAMAATQLGGFGSVISFEVAGTAIEADQVCHRTHLIQHATSLGSVESTMERRGAVPGQEHLPETLLRLSVGIENPADLWADLTQTLDASADC